MLRKISYFVLGLLLGAVAMIFWASNADAVEYSPNGTSGLNLVYNGNDDDNSYAVNLPWTINFLGTNYNSVYVGTNGYITFSSPNSTYSGFSASNPAGPHISMYPADRRLYKLYYAEIGAGTAQARFVIRAEGVDYSNAAVTYIWEVHFYPGTSYFNIYFVDAPSSGNAGTTGISNGSSYISTYTTTELTGIRINANGTLDVGAPTYPGYMTVTGTPGTMTYGTSAAITNSQQTRVTTFTNKTITNNSIYIDQVGDNNSLNVTQVGRNNEIKGVGQQASQLQGNSNTIIIRQGDSTTDTGKNSIEMRVIGGSNNLNINQSKTSTGTGTNSTNGHYQLIDISGYTNVLTTQQTNTGGVGGHYMETTITGNTNNVITNQKDNGNKIMFTTVSGNNNTVTAVQEGTGQHYLESTLIGNSNTVTATQSGNTQNSASISITNAGGPGSVDLQQSGGANYNITTTCVTAGGCGTVTVRQ